ncbi:parB-like partition protein [Candidatus Omnitrophus magneticus]|uniref:ParB-like partition protein n=1 Tax=Candidatus Omnitrophus magneticus TaxID=1609969 RepID=A0A0F0CSK9_9BACT|nr:parB-like partition protein [Candidatus Omnitrophus magneticus]
MANRLGKGLGALLPVEKSGENKEKIEHLKIGQIVPNKFQPRKTFEHEKMRELVSSIKEQGVIQPILVRQSGDVFEIIAGERRWRAAKELQIPTIPAIIKKEITDGHSLELSIIENIQREELNPIEEAMAYKELQDKFEHSLDKIGQMVGKDKTTISNSLRLLRLPLEIQKFIEQGKISTGHAKVLLSIPNHFRQTQIGEIIVKQGISVRQLEELVKDAPDQENKKKTQKDLEIKHIEEELQRKLGTKVKIKHKNKKGRIEIFYYSNNDLNRLVKIFIPGF